MSKLIEQVQNQQLPIVAGNDFGINVCVTELTETGAYDLYVFSPVMNPKMFLVSSNGKRIDTKCTVENDGTLSALIPGNYLSKSAYGIEIIFTTPDDGRNHRTYAPELIKIVTTTEAANEGIATYNQTDPYRFNIKLVADVAYLNIGSLPSEYITEDDLATVLTSYVTSDDLTTTLTAYVTSSDLATILNTSSYATTSSVENQINALWQDCNSTFIDNDELATTLSSYVTNSSLENTLSYYDTSDEVSQKITDAINGIPEPDLSNYVTKPYLSQQSYVTTSDLSQMSYVTSSSLNTTLEGYVNDAQYDSSNHAILLKHDSTTIASIDASPFIIDGMVDTVTISNGYLVISFNTDAGKQDISIPISDIFDASNYYTKGDIDTTLTSYVTSTELTNAGYVTHTELDNAAYITINDVPQTDLTNYTTFSDIDAMGYVTASDLSNMSYVTSTELTNAGYVTASDLSNMSYLQSETDPIFSASAAAGITSSDITSWNDKQDELVSGTNIKTINNQSLLGSGNITIQGGGGGTVPDNVVTSYDGTYIYCLSQSDYDTLEQGQQLDPDTFYYITDASSDYVTYTALNSYATKNYVDTAVAGVTIDESNLVHLTDSETITGEKTFTNTNRFTGETKFENTDGSGHLGNFTWIDTGVYKSSLFTRAEMDQVIVAQIWAPQVSTSDSSSSFESVPNTITFSYIASIPNPSAPTLTQLAKIDPNGIYEGNTLLANKYVQSSDVRNIVQISQSDYNNLGTPDANTLYVIV